MSILSAVHFDNVLVCNGGTCTGGGGGGGTTNQVQTSIAQGVGISWFASNGIPYQVQYATDLVNSNWTSLGGQITGPGSSNTVFDAFGNFLDKFYRVLSLQ